MYHNIVLRGQNRVQLLRENEGREHRGPASKSISNYWFYHFYNDVPLPSERWDPIVSTIHFNWNWTTTFRTRNAECTNANGSGRTRDGSRDPESIICIYQAWAEMDLSVLFLMKTDEKSQPVGQRRMRFYATAVYSSTHRGVGIDYNGEGFDFK